MIYLPNAKFAGLDPALRVDNTAFVLLERHSNGVFEELGVKVWPHVNFRVVANDIQRIWDKERFNMMGYDRTGLGDIARELLPPSIPNKPIITSAPQKLNMITAVQSLFQNKKLIIHTRSLYEEIMEQQKKISDAGNILYEHPAGHHDDRFWAMCYAVNAAEGYVGRGMTKTTGASIPIRDNSNIEDIIQRDIQMGLKG